MFCERLKQLRVNKSMSQKDLADKLKISQQTVAKWENGLTSPKPATLKLLTELFDVSSDYLLGIPPKINEHDIKAALFGEDEEIDDEMYDDVIKFARFLKENKRNN